MAADITTDRRTVFISKATPEDDEFVLWLAPRLEAAGYLVFADILNLDGGDRWRKVVTHTLQNNAIKMLLCCRDESLAKDGVQEEIAIAEDLSKELKDPQFIIPLRLAPFKKLFGIGGLQYKDLYCRWAQGLDDLLQTLEKRQVPKAGELPNINPNWEAYRKRLSIQIEQTPEELTSNWLVIQAMPKTIRYFEPTGALNHTAMERACKAYAYPAEVRLRGFFSFAEEKEVEQSFAAAGRFRATSEFELEEFVKDGCQAPSVEPQEASNMLVSMFRQAWERYCRESGFESYAYATQTGFHVGKELLPMGKKVSWGPSGERRSSMLRNIAGGRVWSYGVSASPHFWPYPHFKLKARVLFATVGPEKEAGPVLPDVEKQHRARRTICKGWRNPRWHGQLMAYMKLLVGADNEQLKVPLSETQTLLLDAEPQKFTSPVSTRTVREMADDGEETDLSTLGTVLVEVEPE